MSEINVQIATRPHGWADIPPLNHAQKQACDSAEMHSLIVRGAPGSGRSTCALEVFRRAIEKGEDVVIIVPDRVRAQIMTPRAQFFAPRTLRPVRTLSAFAYRIVNQWRVERQEPLGGIELVTGAMQDQLIQDLLESADIEWPDSISQEMRGMSAFRDELRDLFSRAGEAGMDGIALSRAGHDFDKPQWVAAGELLRRYLEQPQFALEYQGTLAVDISRIQALAADVLGQWQDKAASLGITGERPLPDLVIVDDLQDCTASTITLLAQLHQLGSRIVAFADSDVAVATYRGGEPHLDGRLEKTLHLNSHELGDVYTTAPVLRERYKVIAQGIAHSDNNPRRQCGVAPQAQKLDGKVITHVGGSYAQLGAHVSHALRAHFLHDKIAWKDQVVIVRSEALAEETRRYLRRGGIPVTSHSTAFDFRSIATTRILLELMNSHPQARGDECAEALIHSPLIQCDGMKLYSLLQRVSAWMGASIQDAPLVTASTLMSQPDLLTNQEIGFVPPELQRAAQMWGISTDQEQRPRQLLWMLWDAANVGDDWKERALANDQDSSWYDDQLDAVLSLMRVADVWEQRNPDGNARDFAKELLDHTVPVDTISRVAVRPDGVRVITPAQAMGRHWSVVVLIGLQDGVWPNTRLRTRAMRGDLLADVALGRTGDGANGRVLLDEPQVARRAVLDDERRLLAAAVSRCSTYLHLGVVVAEDYAPSRFYAILVNPEGQEGGDIAVPTPAPAPLNLEGQIAELRRAASAPDESEDEATAASLLALLAREGISSADPDEWTGEGPLTSQQRIASQRVVLSPSRIEAMMDCPLRWFFSSIGAQPRATNAQSVGQIIHELAEVFPRGSTEELQSHLLQELERIDIDMQTWGGIEFKDAALDKVEHLAEYLAQCPHDIEIATERAIEVDMDGVTIRGRLDRLEVDPDGRVHIVDFKTGKVATKQEAKDHAQLAIYQIALAQMIANGADLGLDRQASEVNGAKLVFLAKKLQERTQSVLDEDEKCAWHAVIQSAGEIARGIRLQAKPDNMKCSRCVFARSCPAQDSGRRTVD